MRTIFFCLIDVNFVYMLSFPNMEFRLSSQMSPQHKNVPAHYFFFV